MKTQEADPFSELCKNVVKMALLLSVGCGFQESENPHKENTRADNNSVIYIYVEVRYGSLLKARMRD